MRTFTPPVSSATPTTQAAADAAVVGTSLLGARSDHKHAMPTNYPPVVVATLPKSGAYAMQAADVQGMTILQVGLTGTGPYTITLPPPSTARCAILNFAYAASGTITIARNGSENIFTASGAVFSLTLSAQYKTYTLYSDGGNWIVMAAT